ncbi:MAG: NfeD family protein [bacterium]|nr:NfeD family protein [bacterium]
MATYYWLAAFVVLLVIELATMALTTIWFAGGALVSCLVSIAGAGVKVQLVVFVVVSFALLIFTRPFLMRHVNGHLKKTNVDSLIGKRARVSSVINNELGVGAAVVGGQEWTARAQRDEDIIEAETQVEIVGIHGVKLIVKRMEEK